MSTIKYSTTLTVDSGEPDVLGMFQANKDAIIASIIQQYISKTADIIEEKIKSAIKQYYGAYSPTLYGRTYSLYGVYRFDKSPSNYSLILDESLLGGSHRVGDGYIYEKMFKEGFHGGAPHDGGMYWRWPSKPIGNLGRYSMWYPWGPAPQSEPPFSIMANDINQYVNTEGAKIIYDIICKEINKLQKGA